MDHAPFKVTALAALAILLGWLAAETASDLSLEPARRSLAAGDGVSAALVENAPAATGQPGYWATGSRCDFVAALDLTVDRGGADRFSDAEMSAQCALARAPSQPMYWFRLAAARYGAGDISGAADALAVSFVWGGVLDDAALARARLSDRLWDRLDETARRAALREVRLMTHDRHLLNGLGDAFEQFSPGFRREIIAAADPSMRLFLIRRIRRNAAGR